MSVLKMSDLHSPPNNTRRDKIMRHVAQFGRSEQAVAASLATDPLRGATPIDQPDNGGSLYLFFTAHGAAAAGESMSVDVLKNGVSVLTAPFVYDNTKPAGTQIDFSSLIIAGTTVKTGDLLTTTRVYVAGGGPTPIGANAVRAEWSAGENG